MRRIAFVLLAALVPMSAFAQATSPQTPSSSQPQSGQTPSVTLPPVTVVAQKEPTDAKTLPVSVTAVLKDTLTSAGVEMVSEAARYAPNTYFVEFTARKLSNARFRGVGASPANPGVTTFIDDVPQLNANSSSIQLMDIKQIEFVRGPQSALFGRNALGGLVNIVTDRPSETRWTGSFIVPLGNFGARDVQGSVSGPLGSKLAVGLTVGHGQRDGFTRNDITGHDLDSRSATFGKGQLLWRPTQAWQARLIVTSERARDGDYALNDLDALRKQPHHAARDFEGKTDRTVTATTVLTRGEGRRLTLATTTGWVRWNTRDVTDLDYTPLPLVTRDNSEKDFQFTQEIRVASSASAPVKLSKTMTLRWQSGMFLFKQNYDQDAINSFAPFLLSPQLGFAVTQTSPLAALDDHGLGVYGQATVALTGRIEVSGGLRADRETKTADLKTFFTPQIAPSTSLSSEKIFTNVSPNVALAYRLRQDHMVYVSVGKGFKAGGFNPVSIPGTEIYDEERTWNIEGGVKFAASNGKLAVDMGVFSLDWSDLQLNLPIPGGSGQFYISNIGSARSRGFELELTARPRAHVDVFAGFGYTHARFADGSVSEGADVSGKKLPNTPDFTANIGAQYSTAIGPMTAYARGDVLVYGAFQYDEGNTASQKAYSVVDFRAGARRQHVFAELWLKNALDTHYVPIAFAYRNFAPSGFVGESGRPRTVGIRAGVSF
jgi:iron complex outermembrane recepter protein